MISRDKLMQILIKGRYECYIRKSADYNPYVKSDPYDWEFKLPINGFIFSDAYRGFNPYSGVEYVYKSLDELLVWTCDYVGYVNQDAIVPADRVYEFLKEARGAHLLNCNGNLFSDYSFESELFRYETHFHGDIRGLLQKENFFFEDRLVAQQMTAGRLRT